MMAIIGKNSFLILGCVLTLFNTATGSSLNEFQRYVNGIIQLSQNTTFRQAFKKHTALHSLSQTQNVDEFRCEPIAPSEKTPESVHRLRPGDIDVVAAMGDSYTAGLGIKAKTILGLLRENRGLSWSIGGDETIESVTTLPNILRIYNPNLKGFSVGNGREWSRNSHLNVAVTGAASPDMIEQAMELVSLMESSPEIDFENDWKMITIFIGGNDLCRTCKEKETYTSENYKRNLEMSLDILYNEVPRAFVNLVTVFHVQMVRGLSDSLVCDVFHLYVCKCVTHGSSEDVDRVNQINEEFRVVSHALVNSGRYDGREDFTVVIQPFFEDTQVPYEEDGRDLSYFAPDCFHLSKKGHSAVAIALWNNLVEPITSKRTAWTSSQRIVCPTEEHPYFYTRKNSLRGNSMTLGNQAPKNETNDKNTFPAMALIIIYGIGGSALLVSLTAILVAVIRHKETTRNISEATPFLSVNSYSDSLESSNFHYCAHRLF